MSDSSPSPALSTEAESPVLSGSSVLSEDGVLLPDFVARIKLAIEEGDSHTLVALIEPVHESELGDLLAALDGEERAALVALSGNDFNFSALREVDEAIRLEIVNAMPNRKIALALNQLDSDDAVYILEDMKLEDREEILSDMSFEERLRLRRSLEYPEESAGRRMQGDFIAVPPFWTVGQAIDYMRDDENLPERFHEIFVVSPRFDLLGSVELDRILRAQREVKIEALVSEINHPVLATLDQEEAAEIFQRYDLVSAAVVDENNRLVGVLTIDDVVDVIQEEAEEDIKRLAGIGDEEISDSVLEATRSRFTWLFINLVTSIGASLVIGVFDATIEHMVALAILMPIVASMGGNAGTQTMTIVVRALATRDIDIYNAGRVIRREIFIGLLNGVLFAVLIGPVAGFWFGNLQLGVIIGVAMIFNMICAAVAGIFIPLLLDKSGVDPAISSGVFVTTVTDVIGFFAFLGLAAWWFGIF